MLTVPSLVVPNTFRPLHSTTQAPVITFDQLQSPTSTMFRPNDVYLNAPHNEPMNFMNSRPVSIAMPGPTLPSMDDPSASQVYLQAMNCTPTNFFEGFSSETAMMDYFSWQQDAGPTNNNFTFQ
jgi:hypothetical protein